MSGTIRYETKRIEFVTLFKKVKVNEKKSLKLHVMF